MEKHASSGVNTITKDPQILPENGSVIIIDDRADEALPIVKALSKKGISTAYFNGSKDGMPEDHFNSVRLVFLDLQLINSSDENVISKSLINVLDKLISKDNGPYLLVIWSKKYNLYSNHFKTELNKIPYLIPSCILNFDKISCLETKTYPSIDTESFLGNLNQLLEGKLHKDDLEEVHEAVKGALHGENATEYEAKPNAIQIIENQLKTELKKAGAFHLFVIWENIIKRAAAKMVNDIASLAETDDHWEVNIRDVLKRMGVARIGQNTVPANILIAESINTLNSSLIDNLESELKNEPIPDYISLESNVIFANKVGESNFTFKRENGFEILLKDDITLFKAKDRESFKKGFPKDKKLSQEDIVVGQQLIRKYDLIPFSLNTKLHIELSPSQELIPGNIYNNIVTEKKSQYLHTFFQAVPEDYSEFYLIDLEVSPICDYAQKKWKRSRTLPGVIYPAEAYQAVKKGNHFYDVEPTFNINGKECRFRFDFHLFNALDKKTAKERKVMYRLKRELLSDIIAQLSSHVNRPGISFIS